MAATFFGEVVKAPCRAGTEEEEEEEEQSRRDTPEDREVRRQLARKREVRLLRRQTETSLEAVLLETHPCSNFLRALKTQTFKDALCCPLLEQPNIVHDLSAAVLSYCQVWKIPAVLYLCYTDVMKLDRVTVEAFKPLLSSRSLKCLVKNIPESTEILKKLMTTNEIQSNIYT
ncbi:Down syndrome critical region homolog 2 (human), isoform CRA_b [Mus musculus]|nr:Down syndrome critical region homolog 2 (human), isoform CRA_b [Mus musculus]